MKPNMHLLSLFYVSSSRPSISPSKTASTSNALRAGPHSQIHRKSLPSSVSEATERGPISSTAPKRIRSPPLSFTANETVEGNSISSEDNSERYDIMCKASFFVHHVFILSLIVLRIFILIVLFSETLAKAKRLARFKVELNKSEQNNADAADQKTSANRHEQSVLEQKYAGGHVMDSAGNFTNGHAVSDHEGFETSNVIIGLCPDMCPGMFLRFYVCK